MHGADVGGHHQGVALQSDTPRALQRRPAKARGKGRVVEREDLAQVHAGARASLGHQLGPGRRWMLALERADFLAHVAAEQPRTDPAAQLVRDHARVLDREVGDAATRIQHVGRGEGLRGTGLEAAHARAAVAFAVGGRGRGELDVHEHLAQEPPRAAARQDETRVLADEAETGARGHGALEQRRVVAGAAGLAAAERDSHVPGQGLQARSDECVVVAPPGVARNASVASLVLERARVLGIGDRHRDDALHACQQRARIGSLRWVARHVGEVRAVAGVSPGLQPCEIVRQHGGVGHPHHLEAVRRGEACELVVLRQRGAHAIHIASP